MRRILADPARRRLMVARATVSLQAMEGIDITLEESLASYDRVVREKRTEKMRSPDQTEKLLAYIRKRRKQARNLYLAASTSADSDRQYAYMSKWQTLFEKLCTPGKA